MTPINPKSIELAFYTPDRLEIIWQQGFRQEQPEWKKWDGPYFDDDYQAYPNLQDFLASPTVDFLMKENCRCILLEGQPIGTVSYYWENRKTLWLNIGISVYDPKYWNRGIGSQALKQWISWIFQQYPELQHIGLTTWSGNDRMMKAAEKLGMRKEAQIRKVRFHQNHYYDSVSYGVLRDEWDAL